mmetsp:Transcript_28409/g.48295  ORF Transcript_28409/g.48295 Transcript_28409/m.48295 type:complete len:346 (-) Transcript_28409:169-1206(-)
MFLHLHHTRQLLPAKFTVRTFPFFFEGRQVECARFVRCKFGGGGGLMLANAAIVGFVEGGGGDVVGEEFVDCRFESFVYGVFFFWLFFLFFVTFAFVGRFFLICFRRRSSRLRRRMMIVDALERPSFVLRQGTLGQWFDTIVGRFGKADYARGSVFCFCLMIFVYGICTEGDFSLVVVGCSSSSAVIFLSIDVTIRITCVVRIITVALRTALRIAIGRRSSSSKLCLQTTNFIVQIHHLFLILILLIIACCNYFLIVIIVLVFGSHLHHAFGNRYKLLLFCIIFLLVVITAIIATTAVIIQISCCFHNNSIRFSIFFNQTTLFQSFQRTLDIIPFLVGEIILFLF